MSDCNEYTEINRKKPDEVTKRLLELIDRCDYQLVQENGQRRLTSPSSEPRIKGAEIFLGRLPRDCYEDELVPLLSSVGRVVELRLMMDFSGSTRGYAFALFEHRRIARLACEKLNGYEIRPGHKIGVVKSIDNCRLFLGGVPKDKTRADFVKELGKMLDGITNIYVYPSTEDKSLNRGFVFVEFKDHRSAAMARRKLIPGRVMLWNHEVAVDWADPEPGQDIDDEVMETVSALFVRNLSIGATESETRNVIQRLTRVPIMKIKKINHFAFLHYETRAQAQIVLDIMNQSRDINKEISEWEVTWAKPIRKSQKPEDRLRWIKNGSQSERGVQKNQSGSKKSEKILNNSDDNRSDIGSRTSADSNLFYSTKSKILELKVTKDSIEASLTSGKENRAVYSSSTASCAPCYTITANETPKIASTACGYENDLFECVNALEKLAADKFNARLRYEYFSDVLGLQYACKIILERNGCELMSYQGNPVATMQQAFQFTVRDAYNALYSMLIHAIKCTN